MYNVYCIQCFFLDIFGKRGNRIFDKRCTNSCPVCDKLDIKKHSKEQVLQSGIKTSLSTSDIYKHV